MTHHLSLNLFRFLCLSNNPVVQSRFCSYVCFAIGGHACSHQKSLHNITACPATLLKTPLGVHSLITHHCDGQCHAC